MAKMSARRKSILDNPEEVLNLAQIWLERLERQWKWIAAGLALAAVLVVAWGISASLKQGREERAAAALAQVRPKLAAPEAGDEAAKALEQVAREYPGTKAGRDAILLWANLLYQQKNYAEAAKAYEALLPSGDPAWDNLISESLSYCYEGLGDFKKGAATLKGVEAQTEGPLKGDLIQRLALLLEKAGDYQEAAAYWKKLIEAAGNPAMKPYLQEKLAAAEARKK